jgi:flagellar hook-associated protein 3 FlgL
MRVTNSLFYTNAANNYQRNMQELYKTNAQISSGLKIQNSFEDSSVYVDTMRLNYEVATLEQVKESSSKAQTYANNTDKVLNQFTDALSQFKTKLIQSANESNSSTSLDALANELQALRDHMVSLGNTSINGQYLFSGTSFTSKPVSADGTYNGNDESMQAIIGSGVKLPYNVTGEDLFLGKDSDFSRVLSTNVKMYNQSLLHPKTMSDSGELSQEVYLNESDTIRDMVGDNDSDLTNDADPVFYLSGRKPDGTTFKTSFLTSGTSKVSDLLDRIGQEFGNTTTNQVVNVTMNEHGQIEIKDLKKGNSLLEMNLFAAVDRDGGAGATQADIDDLLAQKNVDIISFNESNFKGVNSAAVVGVSENIYNPGDFSLNTKLENIDGTDVTATDILRSFMGNNVDQIVLVGTDTSGAAVNINFPVGAATTTQDLMTGIENNFGNVSARIENGQIYVSDNSGTTPSSFNMTLTSQDTVAVTNVNSFMTPDSMNYERRGFEKDGNTLSSNISQIVKSTDEYATNKTKLSEVAGVSLNTKQFLLSGLDNSGNAFNAQIDFTNAAQATFSLDGGTTNYTIFDATGGSPAANDMTYRQLSDVVSMILSGNIPATTNTFSDYENAVSSSKGAVEVGLDNQGKLEIYDKFNSKSPIEFSMFDSNADSSSSASTLTFMANDSVKIDDPNIDFYKDLDTMIEAVREGTFRMDSKSDNPRNIGIQNSLNRIDHIMTHVTKEHTRIGSYSNALSQATERSELLSINVQTVRSEVIDVDIGEAYMKFNQLSNSYQAMLSTVAKINSMSLLNYM